MPWWSNRRYTIPRAPKYSGHRYSFRPLSYGVGRCPERDFQSVVNVDDDVDGGGGGHDDDDEDEDDHNNGI